MSDNWKYKKTKKGKETCTLVLDYCILEIEKLPNETEYYIYKHNGGCGPQYLGWKPTLELAKEKAERYK